MKINLEQEINKFLEVWDYDQQYAFLRDGMPIIDLYDVQEDNDWVEKEVGGDKLNVSTVRLMRTVYLISRFADLHAGKLCLLNAHFKNMWKKMEKLDAS